MSDNQYNTNSQRQAPQQSQDERPIRDGSLMLLTLNNKRFLEIRQGYTPIMVPSHLVSNVRTVLAQHLRPHIENTRGQGNSPPQSPASPDALYLPMNSQSQTESMVSPSPTIPTFSPQPPIDSSQQQTLFSSKNEPQISSSQFVAAAAAAAAQTLLTTTPGLATGLSIPALNATEFSNMPIRNSMTFSGTSSALIEDLNNNLNTRIPPSPSIHANTDISDIPEIDEDSDTDMQSEEEELRKPPNAFILYRSDKNRELKEKQPGLNVETASTLIGKAWKNEQPHIRAKYKGLADKARELYFIKKKRNQQRQKSSKKDKKSSATASYLLPSKRSQIKKRVASTNSHVNSTTLSKIHELKMHQKKESNPLSHHSAFIKDIKLPSSAPKYSRSMTTSSLGSATNGPESSISPTIGLVHTPTTASFDPNMFELGSILSSSIQVSQTIPATSEDQAISIQSSSSLGHLSSDLYNHITTSPTLIGSDFSGWNMNGGIGSKDWNVINTLIDTTSGNSTNEATTHPENTPHTTIFENNNQLHGLQ